MKDRYERRHRRTARHPEAKTVMAGADFDAEPSLAAAMGLPANRITLPRWCHLSAEVHCPLCGRRVVEVDRMEGLPIYACPDGCEREAEEGLEPGQEARRKNNA